MDTAARGIGLYFYFRRRWEILGCAIYLLIALIANYLPDFPSRKPFLEILCMPMAALFLYLPGLFANADQDLVSTRSSYPPHLLTLPVRTRSLAFWPMLYGVLLVPPIWLLFASIVLVPHGQGSYLWWPAAMLAALVAVLQAVSWSPLPVPYLRLILLIVLLPGLPLLGIIGHPLGWSIGTICAIYLSIIPICGIVATRGLSRARVDPQVDWSRLSKRQALGTSMADTTAITHRFRTPLRAQIWMEWKRNGLAPVSVVLCLNLLLAAFCRLSTRDSNIVWGPLNIGNTDNIEVPLSVIACVSLSLFIMLVLSGSCTPLKADTLRPDMSLQPFLATRPLTCVQIVAAKIAAAGWMLVTLWAVELLCLAGWLLFPARQEGEISTIGAVLLPYMTPHLVGVTVIGILCVIFRSWCLGMNGLWIELCGKKWLSNLFIVLSTGSITMVIGLGLTWAPEHMPLLLKWSQWLSSSCIVLVFGLAKLALTAAIFSQLLRHRLVTTQQLKIGVCIWVATCLVFFLALRMIVPTRYITMPELAYSVVLFLPLARLSLAPLTLRANRHRKP